jgi:hypothetical protein
MAADSARGRDSRSLLADYYRNPKVTSPELRPSTNAVCSWGLKRTLSNTGGEGVRLLSLVSAFLLPCGEV